MAFQFSDAVPGSLKAAAGALAEDEPSRAQAVAAAALSGLGGASLEEQVAQVSQSTGLKAVTVRKYAAALTSFFRASLRRNLAADEMRSDLMQLGFSAEVAATLEGQYAAAKGPLMEEAIRNTLTVNQLEDIDWRFGLVASSKSMDKVGNTFLQMKIKRAGQETVNVELTLEQFYKFLGEMEKAAATIDSF